MIGNSSTNLLNTHIGGKTPSYSPSQNKYYNIFSKKMEEIDIPNINLEYNAVLIPEKSKFMWTC